MKTTTKAAPAAGKKCCRSFLASRGTHEVGCPTLARKPLCEAERVLAEMAPRLAKAREALLTLEWTGRPGTAPEIATIQRVAHELAELGTVASLTGAAS